MARLEGCRNQTGAKALNHIRTVLFLLVEDGVAVYEENYDGEARSKTSDRGQAAAAGIASRAL